MPEILIRVPIAATLPAGRDMKILAADLRQVVLDYFGKEDDPELAGRITSVLPGDVTCVEAVQNFQRILQIGHCWMAPGPDRKRIAIELVFDQQTMRIMIKDRHP